MSSDNFPKDCHQCPVWKKSLFKELDDELINRITEKKSTVTLKKKAVLFRQGQDVDGLYCHLSGLAKVVQKDEQGNVRFSRLVLPGDTSGHRSLFIESSYKGTTEVISPTLQACHIPKTEILFLLSNSASFARNLVVKISSELVRSEETQMSVREKTVRGRLAQLLCELCDVYSVSIGDNQYQIQSEIPKVDIASILSVANETIIRLMSEMKSEGLIDYQDKRLVINNLSTLKKIASK